MMALVLTAAAALRIPAPLQGTWDLPNQCRLPAGDETDRVIIHANKEQFWEVAFTPRRILNETPQNWTALGRLDGDEDNGAKGRLNLRLSKDGKTLAYTNSDNRIVRLTRCGKK
ncbi:hypothetical protein [Novosphingobium sp. KACC 22771]|uniref:hypothetical protein n=1 Tax=Novosphingobium sp. KACC 22771 TaxID=3025670 RepID=UPI0023663AF2|nr:hypothetical protein [Novosphingobium sp. KACC 22771]WDF72783.1 hypothetical protein PQ467_01720 [Novosphingobium sp. KACC 22771]